MKFIPKQGGKANRLISLTSSLGKLMERIVHRRLEHFIEHRRLIPSYQFGFLKKRSAVDCVSVLVADVLRGFVMGKGTVALALDIKGAFSVLLPSAVLQELRDCGAPARVNNFVAFMISKRNLYFHELNSEPYECGVGYCPHCFLISP